MILIFTDVWPWRLLRILFVALGRNSLCTTAPNKQIGWFNKSESDGE